MTRLAWCIECYEDEGKAQRVEHRLGAWMCPVHHDRGHIQFTAPPQPTLATDATENGECKGIIFLAGAIKWWWGPGRWDSPEHKQYVAHRNRVRAELIDEGYLVYAPHEAFKGTWTEKAQKVNDAGIEISDLMIVLSPPYADTAGTDAEMRYAARAGTPVAFYPPGSNRPLAEFISDVLN